MRRRDISAALWATATAGTTLAPLRAQAQSCTLPCYPQTPAEAALGISPVATQYPAGDVRRYGATGNGSTDDTVAITQANAVAMEAATVAHSAQNNTRVFFPAGTYLYQPSATLQIGHQWEGESVESTLILCNTAGYTGEFFRLTGSCEMRNLFIKCQNLVQHGLGVRIAASDPTQFTGQVRLTRVWVQGFGTNIQADRSFLVTLDQVRSEYGNYGFYCQPGAAAPGPNAYITTHLHLNCYYASNAVNVFYQTDVASNNVTFIGGANESATKPFGADGSSYSSYFGNISGLHFIDLYCENQPAALVISAAGRDVTFDGLYLNGTGGIYLGSNVSARFVGVRTTTSTDLVTGGDGTQTVSMERCSWPSAGNSTDFATATLVQTAINGTFYSSTLPALRQGTGSPQGVLTAPVGTLYLRTDGTTGATLYVKETGTGNTGWIAK